MRRVVSVLLSLCLVCCFFSGVPVKAETLTSGDWNYQVLEDGTVEITGYKRTETEIVIPEEIYGKKVTYIGVSAFAGCSSLTKVEVPSSVKSVMFGAFDGCNNLTSITFQSSKTKIGGCAFRNCSSLESIEIPPDITYIASSAFEGCSSLKSIKIPADVIDIMASVFEGCSSLESIEIPSGLLRIDRYAFSGCSSLTSIEIPASVESIGVGTFSECTGMTSITVDEASEKYSSEDGILYNKNKTNLVQCPNGKQGTATVPASVTKIEDCAFVTCINLTDINVDEASEKYSSEDGILYNKNKTKLIQCPAGKQGPVTIPSSVQSIGNYAFESCSNLTKIEILSNVTSIGQDAFTGCPSLTIYGEADSYAEQYAKDNNIKFVVIGTTEEPTNEEKNWVYKELDDGTVEITGYKGTKTEIVIPGVIEGKSVTSIGYRAFYDCSSLTSIEIPESVTNIGNYAFDGCNKDLTIYGISGSYAEQYAKDNGIKFQEICKEHTLVTDPAIAPTCTESGKTEGSHCSVCGKIMKAQENIPAAGHTEEIDNEAIAPTCTEAGKTEGSHCSVCGEIMEEQEEIPAAGHTEEIDNEAIAPTCTVAGKTEGSRCSVCGEVMKEQEEIPATGHTEEIDKAVAPVCTVAGKTEGSHCSVCGTVMKVQETIPATGHTYVQTIIQATDKQDGSIVEKCSVCGDVNANVPIYVVSNIMLSKVSFAYSGKNQKPVVTVKDSQGMALSADSYEIIYPISSKKVGEYTVTVTLKGNYSGTVQLKYQIVPKGTTISKLTAKKKGFTVKWKKQTKETSGYQIQYSTSSSFKGAKTITVSKNKTVSKEIMKLKAGKKYYVRIRTYKTVKVGGKNKKLYSGWSKAKTVETIFS